MSTLVDPYGNPVSTRLLNGAERYSGKRPSWQTRSEGIEQAIDYRDLLVARSVSRRLCANNGLLKGAIHQKAMAAIGQAWEPVFFGAEIEWGAMATDWLVNEWFPVCNVKGENFDFKTSLYLDSVAMDVDGDNAVLLTETADGYPQLQSIPAHCIGQRDPQERVVKSGGYAGLSIAFGAIRNAQGRVVAYRILGETEADDRDISARDLDFRFEPECVDQSRGFPIFAHALNDMRDADQSQDWEQLAQLAMSSIIMTEHNEDGAVDALDPMTTLGSQAAGTSEITQREMLGGAVRYFKAGSGGKLEAVTSNRPGDAWDSFQDRLIRKALCNVWPYSLVWKPDGMNGTQQRTTIEQARSFIADRQALLAPRARRLVGYAVSKAIKNGILPPYKGTDKGGFLKWTFSTPPEFSIDHGNEDNQWRENYKMGLVTLDEFLSRNSRGTVEAHWRKRAREQALKAQIIAEVERETGVQIDPREMQMLTPNDMSSAQLNTPQQ